jgi:uncharacterized protein
MLQINPIPEVSTSITAFIGEAEFGPINEATLVTSFSDFTRKFGGLSTNSEMSFGVRQYFLNGGTIAIIVRLDMSVDEASVIQAYIGDENLKTGLFALDQVDLFNILCMPGVSNKTVLDKAIAYCIKRRAFLIIDSPKNINSIDGVIDTMIGKQNDGISPPNLPVFSQTDSAAIYFPWIKITNPLTGSSRTSAPSGTIAGIYARTDVQFGVWKTPAGSNSLLKGVIGLDHNVTVAKNELLTPNGINALRFFQNIGFVAWGARTISNQ